MSAFACKVVKVAITPHPNADKLELANPMGTTWQCVVGKGTFRDGDLGIYLPIDSVLTPEIVSTLGIEKFYKTRVKTIRLRGQLSQGLLAPLHIVANAAKAKGVQEDYPHAFDGCDVTEVLGVTKYDPPIPVEMAGIQRKADDRFVKYSEIENFKNYPGVFKDGEFVLITEKIHGTNFRATKVASAFSADGIAELMVGSHNCNLVEAESNVYWRAAKLLNLQEKLESGEQIFGEVYGSGVQDLVYGMKPGTIAVKIFDVMKDGRYLNYPEFVQFVLKHDWQPVPIIYFGEWNKECVALASGMSVIDPTQIREGVVVKPGIKEEYDLELNGRKILKIISDSYLERKDATERH